MDQEEARGTDGFSIPQPTKPSNPPGIINSTKERRKGEHGKGSPSATDTSLKLPRRDCEPAVKLRDPATNRRRRTRRRIAAAKGQDTDLIQQRSCGRARRQRWVPPWNLWLGEEPHHTGPSLVSRPDPLPDAHLIGRDARLPPSPRLRRLPPATSCEEERDRGVEDLGAEILQPTLRRH